RGAEVVEDARIRRQLAERLLVELLRLGGLAGLHLLVALGDVGLLARDRVPGAAADECDPEPTPPARVCSFFSGCRSARHASTRSNMKPGKRRNWYASLGMLSTRSSRLPSLRRASAFTTASTLNPRGSA